MCSGSGLGRLQFENFALRGAVRQPRKIRVFNRAPALAENYPPKRPPRIRAGARVELGEVELFRPQHSARQKVFAKRRHHGRRLDPRGMPDEARAERVVQTPERAGRDGIGNELRVFGILRAAAPEFRLFGRPAQLQDFAVVKKPFAEPRLERPVKLPRARMAAELRQLLTSLLPVIGFMTPAATRHAADSHPSSTISTRAPLSASSSARHEPAMPCPTTIKPASRIKRASPARRPTATREPPKPFPS